MDEQVPPQNETLREEGDVLKKWELMQQQEVHLPCPGRRGTVTLYRILSLGISGSTKER